MRKKLFLPELCLFLLILFTSSYGQWVSPESAVFDSVHNRYLISDQGTGCIVAVDSEGGTTNFNCSFSTVKGLMIRNDTLFCAASQSGLAIIDLETGALLTSVYSFLTATAFSYPASTILTDS